MPTPKESSRATTNVSTKETEKKPQKPSGSKGVRSVSQQRQNRVHTPQKKVNELTTTTTVVAKPSSPTQELLQANQRILELEQALALQTQQQPEQVDLKDILDNICATVLSRTYSSDQEKYDRVLFVITKMKNKLANAIQENVDIHKQLSAQNIELEVMNNLADTTDFGDDDCEGEIPMPDLGAAVAIKNVASGTVKIGTRYFNVMVVPHKQDKGLVRIMGYESESAAEVGEIEVALVELCTGETCGTEVLASSAVKDDSRSGLERDVVFKSLQDRLTIISKDGQEVFKLTEKSQHKEGVRETNAEETTEEHSEIIPSSKKDIAESVQ